MHQEAMQCDIVQAQLAGKRYGPRQRCGGQRCGHIRQTEKSQLGWGRIADQCGHTFQHRHGQRPHAFAQRGFECVFPARLHLQLVPQRGQILQTVSLQPRQQGVVGLHLLLQRLQGLQAGGYVGQGLAFTREGGLGRLALAVGLGLLRLQRLPMGLGLGVFVLRLLPLLLGLGHSGVVGQIQRSAVAA